MDRGERTKKIASISLELQMNVLTAICVGMFVPFVYYHLYAAECLDVSHVIHSVTFKFTLGYPPEPAGIFILKSSNLNHFHLVRL